MSFPADCRRRAKRIGENNLYLYRLVYILYVRTLRFIIGIYFSERDE
jgi:hypothetical protein